MGCDGGTIPKRDELVKTKKKPEKADKDVENAAKWNYCHLSQEKLRTPIVVDLLGFIYNKEAILEFLIERSKYEAGPAYVKSLKDTKELNLTPNPGYKPEFTGNGSEFVDLNCSRWICPITGLEMNGVYKFYCIYSCGCVLSERALKTMQSNNVCLKCEKPYKSIDLIALNANEEDLDANQDKYNQRKKEKAEKSKKTVDSKDETKSTASAASASTSSASSASVNEAKSSKVSDSTKTHEAKKRDHATSSGSKHGKTEKEKQPAKKVKTIQDDPNVSEVYKSLFSTHEKAKKQGKAHWVTYNPLFN